MISLQVIQEYFAAATRKLRVDPEIAQRKVEIFARGNVVRFEPDDVVRSIELHRLLRISFWDALISMQHDWRERRFSTVRIYSMAQRLPVCGL